MRRGLTIITCAWIFLGGCATGHDVIRQGTPITQVQADFGRPDMISDQSGSLARYYFPTKRPADEWPADAPRTFYYFGRDLAVTFVSGKAVNTEPIDKETRDMMVQFIRKYGGPAKGIRQDWKRDETPTTSPTRKASPNWDSWNRVLDGDAANPQ